jgi:hypothetical protein
MSGSGAIIKSGFCGNLSGSFGFLVSACAIELQSSQKDVTVMVTLKRRSMIGEWVKNSFLVRSMIEELTGSPLGIRDDGELFSYPLLLLDDVSQQKKYPDQGVCNCNYKP